MLWLRVSSFLAMLLFATAWAETSRADGETAPPSAVLSQQVNAGPLNISFTIDRATITSAQSLLAVLRVSAPTGVQVDLPPSEPKLGQFTVLSLIDEPQKAETDSTALRSVFVRRYVLEPFLPGEYTIPPLDIRWRKTGTTESGIARTAPVKITVQSLLPPEATKDKLDPGTIRDAYTPPQKPDRSSLWIGFMLGAGASLLAIGGAWYARRVRSSGDVIDQGIAAIRERQNSPFSSADSGRSCDVLSTALRNALADRVNPASRASTPDALKSQLANTGSVPAPTVKETVAILNRLDEARFSGEDISSAEFDELARKTLAVLASLRPVARLNARREAQA